MASYGYEYELMKRMEEEKNKKSSREQQIQADLENVFDPNAGARFSVSGSANERQGRIEGLQRARILTGQNPYQIGQDYQEAYGNLKKRTEMADTGSELLRASKAGAVADARQSLQQQGVKGGAATGAVSQVERAKAYDVNNQLMDAQQKAQQEYMNAVKANANFTQASEMNYGSLAAGKDIQTQTSGSSGFTVICTELHRQGYLSDDIMKKDAEHGAMVRAYYPDTYYGYRFLADPVVKIMRKSELFTKLVSLLAVPWAENMAGKYNTIGMLVNNIGSNLCSCTWKLVKLTRRLAHG